MYLTTSQMAIVLTFLCIDYKKAFSHAQEKNSSSAIVFLDELEDKSA